MKYSIICGWLGVIKTASSQQQSVAKPHYISGVENIPPALQTQLELDFQDLELWVIKRLRGSVVEAEQALKQTNASPKSQEATCEFVFLSSGCFPN